MKYSSKCLRAITYYRQEKYSVKLIKANLEEVWDHHQAEVKKFLGQACFGYLHEMDISQTQNSSSMDVRIQISYENCNDCSCTSFCPKN